MDNGDKDQQKKEDFYSKGKTKNPADFVRPPPQVAEQQQQMQSVFQRFMECNRGAFGTDVMRHSYLYDAANGSSVGKGNANTKEAGPSRDSCYWLPGSEGQQEAAFNQLKGAVNAEEQQPNGLPGKGGFRSWFPGTQDCHTMKDHAARSNGIPSYTSRLGESNTRPKVTKEEEARVRQLLFERCLMTGQGCKPFMDYFKKDPPPPPPTGGGIAQQTH